MSATAPTPTATPARITTGTVKYELCATAAHGVLASFTGVCRNLCPAVDAFPSRPHTRMHTMRVIHICDSACVCVRACIRTHAHVWRIVLYYFHLAPVVRRTAVENALRSTVGTQVDACVCARGSCKTGMLRMGIPRRRVGGAVSV